MKGLDHSKTGGQIICFGDSVLTVLVFLPFAAVCISLDILYTI